MKLESNQPAFNVDRTAASVVSISAHVPEHAMSAGLLGTERSGHGVVIRDDGLIATIGYLIAEADSVWIGTGDGTTLPGYVLGYDFETGFGLLRPSMPLQRPGISLGSAEHLKVGDDVLVVDSGGPDHALHAQVAAKQEFAGRWEYLLEEAIYTVPAHSDWAGTALVDLQGRLCGIGSLLVHDGRSHDVGAAANMFVPVDILVPIIDEICEFGRQNKPARPWLGMLIHDDDQLLVAGVYVDCPADNAGLRPGDVIIELDGMPVGGLAEFLRRTWSMGNAGVEVPLTVLRDGEVRRTVIRSGDRAAFSATGTVN